MSKKNARMISETTGNDENAMPEKAEITIEERSKKDTIPPKETTVTVTQEQQPQEQPAAEPKAKGWEKQEQTPFNPDFDLEGRTMKDEEGAEYVFKRVVTKQIDGLDIEKVIPIRKSDDKTLNMNEDVNIIDDWDDRRFIIDKIEGIYVEQEGRAVCLIPGMWDILNNYALHYICRDDLPDHIGFRNVAEEYAKQFRRKQKYNVEMSFDVNMAIIEWLEACIWKAEERKRILREEVSFGQINQKEFLNGLHLCDMAISAMRRYIEGKIKI